MWFYIVRKYLFYPADIILRACSAELWIRTETSLVEIGVRDSINFYINHEFKEGEHKLTEGIFERTNTLDGYSWKILSTSVAPRAKY